MSVWWLEQVLHDHRALDLSSRTDREQLAEAIIAALPKQVITSAIRASTKNVLARRAIRDGAGDLSDEIGRNSAHAVALLLEERE